LPDAYLVTAASGLNVRSGPGARFRVVGGLPVGASVRIRRVVSGWAELEREGGGYVLMSWLRRDGSGAADRFVPLDKQLCQTIMNRCAGMRVRSRLDLNMVADALNRSMLLADAGTRLREVAFLSQSVIETDYFRTFCEYGRGQGQRYGLYHGRGLHQLTWNETYAACSKALFGDDRLVRRPDLILDDIEVNIRATAWFWRDHNPFNRLADAGDVDEIIYRLYGGRITSRNAAVRRSVVLRRGYYTTIRDLLSERGGG
jgi:putative chitinase